MANDPFATEATTADEAQQETPETKPEPKKKSTSTKKKKETATVAENTEGKIVVTLKGGKGYEAPWIVIHANDVQEANDHLNDENLAELIKQTKKVAEFFNGGANTQAANAPKGQPQASTQAPNGQQPPEGYVFKSGVGKNGRAWKAFMPADRNSGLEPIWL